MAADAKKGGLKLKKRLEKQDDKEEEICIANEAIAATLKEKKHIHSIAQVQKLVQQLHQRVVSRQRIQH